MVTAAWEHHKGLAAPVFPHEGRHRKVNLLAVREVVKNGHCNELSFRDMLQLFAYVAQLIEKGAPGVDFTNALAHKSELAIEERPLGSRRLFA